MNILSIFDNKPGHAQSAPPQHTAGANFQEPPKSVQNRTKNRSKFRCHFGLVFGASWVPFGLPFGISWPPKSAQVRPKRPQDRPKTPQDGLKTGQDYHFDSKLEFSKNIEKHMENQCFWLPQPAQDRPKMASSPVKMAQDRPKTAPRRFQDGLEGYFFALENRLRF